MKITQLISLLSLAALLGAAWHPAQTAYLRLEQVRGGSAGRIVTDNGTTAQWVPMSGDASIGAGGAVTVLKANGNTFPSGAASGDLLVGSGPNALSKLGIGIPNQVLTVSGGLPTWATWATGLPAASAAGRLLYDSGSAWTPTSAGTSGQTLRMNGTTPSWSSVLTNDGVNVGVGQPAGLARLEVSAASNGIGLLVAGSGSNPVRVTSTNNNILQGISLLPAAPTSGAAIALMSNENPGAIGDRLAVLDFGSYQSGSGNATGLRSVGVATQPWSSSSRGSRYSLSVCANGSATLVERFRLDHNGDFITQPAGVENATSATGPFFFLGTVNGTPTSAPANSFTGAAALILDRSTGHLRFNLGGTSAWSTVTSSGAPSLAMSTVASTSAGTSYTIMVATDVQVGDTSSGGLLTLTLPSASARGSRMLVIKRAPGSIANVQVVRADSDTIEGGIAVTLSSSLALRLIPVGTDWLQI